MERKKEKGKEKRKRKKEKDKIKGKEKRKRKRKRKRKGKRESQTKNKPYLSVILTIYHLRRERGGGMEISGGGTGEEESKEERNHSESQPFLMLNSCTAHNIHSYILWVVRKTKSHRGTKIHKDSQIYTKRENQEFFLCFKG